MRAISLSRRVFSVLLAAGIAACGDPNTLPPVQFDNVVDTTVLSALTGTPIGSPSGFDGVAGEPRRTDLSLPFDIAVDAAPDGTWRVYPSGTLGLSSEPGVVVVGRSFDGVLSAPLEGYVADSAVVVAAGTVFVLRSRNSPERCAINTSLPRYAKFHVLAEDAAARTLTLEFLVNRNCGYRNLEPGTPEN